MYPEFTPGTRVRSVFGEVFTVASQQGCMVFVRERCGWFHPSKLFKVQ